MDVWTNVSSTQLFDCAPAGKEAERTHLGKEPGRRWDEKGWPRRTEPRYGSLWKQASDSLPDVLLLLTIMIYLLNQRPC